ncbi:growth factor receptor-bound protein 14 isoform X1 [Hydra vulgaris]|nr:growth factor receptor-bound protein 14 isoform X1 [Hydra vulgaris]
MDLKFLTMFKVATMCWRDRNSRAKDFGCNDADLDAVLENINLLLNDMEEDLNSTESNPTQCEANKTKESIPTISLELSNDVSTPSLLSESMKNDLLVSSPASSKNLNHKLKSILSHQNFKQKLNDHMPHEIPYRNILRSNSKVERISSEPVNPTALKNLEQNVSNLTLNGRESLSANSSPVLNATQLEEKYNKAPRLSLTDADKFDVSILCPDGVVFKADVYKAWTAFQIAWKIAHVKGIHEKLAIVIEENIGDLFLVRPIEDHEKVYSVVKKWAPSSNNSLSMVERLDKYDLFNEPNVYLPQEMCEANSSTEVDKKSLLLGCLVSSEIPLSMRYAILIKDFDKKVWLKKFLWLKESCLYISDAEGGDNLTKIFDTKTSCLFHCLPEFSRAHKSPTPYCFCVVPDIVTEWSEIKCFCAESDMILTGWFTGFRIAKYGQQLYMNFRDAMNKEANLRRTNVARHSLLFRRPHSELDDLIDNKVALDFSGSNSRIISNPLELMRVQNEIAFEIPKTSKRISATFSPVLARQSLLQNKPWYHGKCNREQSQHKLKLHGLKKGMFLIRESCTSAGNLVLTVVTQNKKITHYQIFQSFSSGVLSYSIENGPQFNSLDLLIGSYHSGSVEGVDFVLKKPCPS